MGASAIKCCYAAIGSRLSSTMNKMARWVFCDVEMENLASIVFDDEETIQDSEGEGRHGEEVHGRDDLVVIAQEGSPELPCLLGRRQAPDVARNCAFRDVEAE